jgi:hypothetical protein
MKTDVEVSAEYHAMQEAKSRDLTDPVWTPEMRAKVIAEEANECCTRSDGYEEAIEALALKHIRAALEAAECQRPHDD